MNLAATVVRLRATAINPYFDFSQWESLMWAAALVNYLTFNNHILRYTTNFSKKVLGDKNISITHMRLIETTVHCNA